MKPQKTVTLGHDLTVNRIGYGALYLTGPGYWGPPENPNEAKRLLRRAVDLGVNFIDTADSYGPGFNEQIIADALHPYPSDLVIATKGGMLRSGPDDWRRNTGRSPYIVALGRPEYLRQQVELSLRNLKKDCIDLYQLHRIDERVPLAEQFGVLGLLQSEGKIRHIGVTGQPTVTVQQLASALEIVDIAAVENNFSIGQRSGEEVLRFAEAHGIVFIPWFPLGHGDLLRPDGALSHAAENLEFSAAQLGLGWLLAHSSITLPIPGTTSIAHLEENMGAANVDLDRNTWSLIEEQCATEDLWVPGAEASDNEGDPSVTRQRQLIRPEPVTTSSRAAGLPE